MLQLVNWTYDVKISIKYKSSKIMEYHKMSMIKCLGKE